MAYVRFYRRIPIIPGLIFLNLSKSGVSLSFGKRGWTVTIGRTGIRFTVGLPGSGLSITKHKSFKKTHIEENHKPDIEQFIGVTSGKKKEG